MTISSLPPDLETQIQAYQDRLFGNIKPWDYTQLEVEILKYFDQNWNDTSKVDALFNRFAGIWAIFYQLREFIQADFFWDLPLEYADKWEKTRNKRLHKGTPYYFRAMAAVIRGNIDRGFLFFHQALIEDETTFGSVLSTPAWKFVTLDYLSVDQAAFQIVKSRADWLDQRLCAYHQSRRGSLPLADLRSRVLNQPRLRDATFSFVHSVFRCEDILSLPEHFRLSSFASQLELDMLFSLCRIAEVWLKDRQPPQNKDERQLGGQLVRFFNSQQWLLDGNDLRTINSLDFEENLTALLGGTQGRLSRPFQLVEADLVLVYVLRNQVGHATTSSPVVYSRFAELLDHIFFGLFTIAEKLF